MKVAASPDGKKKQDSPQQLQAAESAVPAKTLAPPPFQLSAAPIQAQLGTVSGESEPESDKDQAPQGHSGSVQLQAATPPSDNDSPTIQREEEQEATNNTAAPDTELEHGTDLSGDQEEVTVNIPGAFDITQGPDAFHEYLIAAAGSLLSNTFAVNLNFNIKLGIKGQVLKGLVGVGGGGMLGVSATLNRQDDRRVRGGYAIKYGGEFVSQLLWFIEYSKEWAGKSSYTGVFRDMAHFGAVTFDVLKNLYNVIAEHSDGDISKFEYGDWSGNPGDMNWEELAQRPSAKVVGQEWSTSESLTASVPGFDAKVSGSRGTSSSTQNFYKQNGDETITKTGTQEVKEASLSAEVEGVGISVGMSYTDINNHSINDNDGSYRNLSITFTNFPRLAKARAGIAESIKNIKDALGSTISPMTSAKLALSLAVGAVQAQVKNMSPMEVNSWKQAMAKRTGEGSGSTNTSFTAEMNWIQTGGTKEAPEWNLQYFRLNAGAGASYDWNGTIPIASFYGVASVDAYHGGSVGAEVSGGMIEVLGNETISYLITVYNGLVYTQDEVNQGFASDRFGRWVSYRTAHMPAMKQMILAIGDPNSNCYKEATGSYGLSASDPLIAAAAADRQSGKVSANTMQLFENFLRRNYEAHMADGKDTARGTDALDSQSAGGGRTPWYRVVGGSSKVYIDMANQGKPVIKRSAYNPDRQAPSKPNTILDSLYQEQKVECALWMNRREEGGIFTNEGGDKLSTRNFNIGKKTDADKATGIIAGQLRSILSSPNKFSKELILGSFRDNNLINLYNAWVNAYNSPTGNRGQNRNRSQNIASTRAAFMTAADPAMEKLAQRILREPIQEAGNDVYVEEGMIFDTEKLRVGN